MAIRYAEVDRSFGEEILRQIDEIVAQEREAKKNGIKAREEQIRREQDETRRFREQRTKQLILHREKVRFEFELASEFLES